jgi:hypothetical protein
MDLRIFEFGQWMQRSRTSLHTQAMCRSITNKKATFRTRQFLLFELLALIMQVEDSGET